MVNARIREDLKRNGDKVLKREGITFTYAVTALYEYLVREQDVPEFLKSDHAGEEDILAKRRSLIRDFAGCASAAKNVSLDELRAERLARQ